jgi:hypothetical protein
MISRRSFLTTSLAAAVSPLSLADSSDIRRLIDAHRPSRISARPEFFRHRIGTTLVHGKYQLTGQPSLIEGASKILELGTRVGKFWFNPSRAATDYPFHSKWPQSNTLAALASTHYWKRVFSMPFHTLMLIAESPCENGWKDDQPDSFYERISKEFEDLTSSLYQQHGSRELTIILQNWEGDWQLRGIGEKWTRPPQNWRTLCDRFARRITARQLGVTRGREISGHHAKLQILHAAEVNRVTDLWSGIPTMTEHVLPQVEVDLVSYSCYDSMKDGPTLYRAIDTIRRYARTNGPHGSKAVYLGEIGIPENVAKENIPGRWDELIGAALAAEVLYISQWQLYCNELNPKFNPHPKPPIHEAWRLRGFWLLKPDGSLTETGKFFTSLWKS